MRVRWWGANVLPLFVMYSQSSEQLVKVDDLSILDIAVSVCLYFIFLYVYLSGE